MMSTDVVTAHALSQRVTTADGTLDILSQIELAVKAGETLAITGASGSGKSTLLALLAGLDQPSAGEVFLFGQRLNDLDEDARARMRAGRVGFVFQSFQLLPALSARENILLPLELAGRDDANERAAYWLDRVGLAERASHTPHQLSGGEQQRVAIARAFAADARIVFADEPTGNLDAETGARIIDMLFDLNAAAATTLILVTHDAALASRCQRSLRLVAGRIAG
ncbi:putative transporter subunit: ATP-binding component of ABC superfamily [Georgfuchsia toluolica]|uniref:Transporter subunit: ATP-binding component of ABC superfamily n=1 Tax=Georgfuchsia toluolica TaxID=424218 RepID=A0A916N352_9PROT|nr:ATP-binding cassette domain-containing protein [Georgfuchsia toluolica]CAG4884619.1 putative transporter subunit: ATP-binding component of ABC superfamily [Georgfuchsia toluolica]